MFVVIWTQHSFVYCYRMCSINILISLASMHCRNFKLKPRFRTANDFTTCTVPKIKVKQSLYRPGQTLRVPGDWGSQISRHSAHEGGELASPTHRPPLPPGNIPSTHFFWRLSRPRGHSVARRIVSMKNTDGIIGNRTRDVQAFSAVHQPTAPHHALFIYL